MRRDKMRRADLFDLPVIKDALLAMLAKSPAPQMKYGDIDIALNYLIYDAIPDGHAWVADGYLILVSKGRPWYSAEEFLIEDLILKIGESERGVAAAIEALEVLAERFGVPLLAVGDTQIGYMTPKYEAAGFKVLGTQLYKEYP